MGGEAFRTADALDGKPDKDRVKLNGTFVTAVTDKTAMLPTGTLDPVELQAVDHAVIIILGKIIAFFKDNCYHKAGESTKGALLLVHLKERQDCFGWRGLSFLLGTPSPMGSFFYRHKTMIT